jgi:branched-chain amino acid transport system substrate-binding protein
MIGAEVDLSGSFSGLGVPWLAGAATYVDWINDHGGANGHPVQLMKLDDQGNPTNAVTAAKQLVAANVLGVVGSTASATQIPAQAVYDAADVANIVFEPTQQLLTNQDFFAVGITPTASYTIQANYCKTLMQKAGITSVKVAFFHINTPAQTANVKVTSTLVQSWGWTVTGNFQYSPGSTDVSPPILQLSATKPDCIIGAVIDAQLPATFNALQQYGVTAPFVNFFAGNNESTFVALHTSQFYAVRDFADASDSAPSGAATLKAAAAKYGTLNNFVTNDFPKGWYSAKALVAAIDKCGVTCNSSSVRMALEAITVSTEGYSSDIAFTATNRVLPQGQMFQWSSKDNRSVAVSGEISA